MTKIPDHRLYDYLDLSYKTVILPDGAVTADNLADTLDLSDKDLILPGGSGPIAGVIEYCGALVKITSDQTGGTTGGTTDIVAWDAAEYDTTFDPDDGGSVQRFWTGASFTFATTDVNTTDNTITKTGHGFVTGESVPPFTSTTTLPAGIAAATVYWLGVVDANTFKLYPTRADSIAGTNAVDFTTQGTGTHTCNRGKYLMVPNGVTKITVSANIISNTNLAGQLGMSFIKNGSVTNWTGNGFIGVDTGGAEAANIKSADLAVTAGDYFGVSNFGSDAWSMDADRGSTWFSINVVAPRRII